MFIFGAMSMFFALKHIYENACVVKLKFMYFSAIMGECLAVIINLNGQII